MNKWMYKIRDHINDFLETETQAWSDKDKNILAQMLFASISKTLVGDGTPEQATEDDLDSPE